LTIFSLHRYKGYQRALPAGTVITLPGRGNMTAPSGEFFDGWTTGGQHFEDGSKYTVNANTSFTAQWDDVPSIVAVDISQETGWHYMVLGEDGSSLFIEDDESTGLPTLMYVKPEEGSDTGFTFLFKENGLPDKMIDNDYILQFGNFNGYKLESSPKSQEF
jgi:hypothetical protein